MAKGECGHGSLSETPNSDAIHSSPIQITRHSLASTIQPQAPPFLTACRPGNVVHARWTTFRTLLSTSPGVSSTISSNGPKLGIRLGGDPVRAVLVAIGQWRTLGPDASKNMDRLLHYWFHYPRTPETCVNGTCQAFILFLLPNRTNHDMPL